MIVSIRVARSMFSDMSGKGSFKLEVALMKYYCGYIRNGVNGDRIGALGLVCGYTPMKQC